MPLIRRDVQTALWRVREILFATGFGAFGLWCIWLGGYVLIPFGAAVVAIATILGIMARRRLRFGQGIHAPGIIDVDEAQLSYFGPDGGGFVSLADVTELRLVWMAGRRFWRLKQSDGQALLLPVDASGADRLFDAFASLPGMDTRALVDAVGLPDASHRNAPSDTGTQIAPAVPRAALGPILWHRSLRPALDSA